MALHETDMVRFVWNGNGQQDYPASAFADQITDWPPPETLTIKTVYQASETSPATIQEITLTRVSHSELDDEAADHPNVARMAVYHGVSP